MSTTGIRAAAVMAALPTLMLISAPASFAQTTYTARWAEQWNEDYPAVKADKFFIDEVTKRSNGRIKFQVFLNGQLGGGPGTVDGVQNGTIQVGTVSIAFLSGVAPHGTAVQLPFLFKDEASAFKAIDAGAGKVVADELQAKKIKLLNWYTTGWSGICNNTRPLVNPDDAKGLNLRVLPNPLQIAEIQALGANAIPMNFTEVFSALQNRTLDGFATSLSVVHDQKWDQVVKYCSVTYDSWSTAVVIMSLDFFNSLPKDLQDIVLEVSKETRAKQIEYYAAYDKQQMDLLTSGSVKLNEVPAATIANWRERMGPVYSKAQATYGEAFMDMLRKAAQ